MPYEFTHHALAGTLLLSEEMNSLQEAHSKGNDLISILWNRNQETVSFEVDKVSVTLQPDQITTLTYFHQVFFPTDQAPLTSFSFNREFYCIQDHDYEVSCNGVIFFGTQDLPIISLDKEESRKFELLHQVFIDEFQTRDNIQGEMLQMLLKRLIIKITRLAKAQLITKELNTNQIDLVRKFNVLVDMHFREKKEVSDYAELLHKSPKTLSNLFAKYNQSSPLKIIHERIILEARRLLVYTDFSIKEIAYELGFEEVTPFNKMFKKIVKESPSAFRKASKGQVPTHN